MRGPVVLISDDARRRQQLLASLPAGILAVALPSHDVTALHQTHDALAVVIDATAQSSNFARGLMVFRDTHPLTPVLWVGTAATIPLGATVVASGSEAVQGIAGRSRLWSAIRVEIVNRMLGDAARRLPLQPTLIASAVAAVLQSDPPFNSVAALARYARCDRGTLYNQWPELLPSAPHELTLADFIDAVLLVRAASLKRSTAGWRHMLHDQLRVRPERLHRIAALCGIPFVEIAESGFIPLIETFNARVLNRLSLSPMPVRAPLSGQPPLASTEHGNVPRSAATTWTNAVAHAQPRGTLSPGSSRDGA
jgi:hypothetical protein